MFTARVFRVLESELNKSLSFSFSMSGNGNGERPRDTLLVSVRVRNNSSIALKNLRGAIRPSDDGAAFRATRFSLKHLGAHQECELAQLRVSARGRTIDEAALDKMGTVSFVSQADLSSFVFRDADRSLTYVHEAIPLSSVSAADRFEDLVVRSSRSNASSQELSGLGLPARLRSAAGES